ncbi:MULTISPECIES: winged helix-turn-helix domain-containing protein [unclassified Curtobacterium]|uniref:helix-turn-helix transcriptional regulator n=1 Tax=unclassified Curtobacterium TaxID=257496 RepID=UPI0008242B8A|nr:MULTISPECIES: winged helix-turn-helix domain-containing protein [unclassified Curtobacterium]WIA98385.1 winged helix-turn-helix domain-containing protein [Curtobacterium sp. MCBA15_004]WIB01639.1 winged helix-turn-helix domain-containing protein [Curtobacterium sp. MCBA15_012]
MTQWTFLTNHAHVLLCVAANPDARVREIAQTVGVTERATQRILTELEDAGYLTKARDGRRNRYTLNPDARMRHPMDQEHHIGELVTLLTAQPAAQGPAE